MSPESDAQKVRTERLSDEELEKNRCFPTKTIAIWHQLDDKEHMQLDERYLKDADSFFNLRGLDRSLRCPFSNPLYAVVGERSGLTTERA